jgi:hypothetical protein
METRKRERNRLRVDWKEGGYPPEMVALYLPTLDAIDGVEKASRRALILTYRQTVPASIRDWQQQSHGIGDHTLARLLGIIGDPIIKVPHRWEGEGSDRVLLVADPEWRTVSDLWSYCGHGDPNRRKRKGMTPAEVFALGSSDAKSIVWNIACGVIKANKGTYRDTYDAARAKYAERPDWTPGHQHAAAIRLVGKTILKDLWRVRHAEVTS